MTEPELTEPDSDLGQDPIRATLTTALSALTGGDRLTLVDLAAGGLVLWELYRDAAGTPGGRTRLSVPWDELFDGTGPPEDALARTVPQAPPGTVVLACTQPDGAHAPKALDALRRTHPQAPSFVLDGASGPIHTLLQEVVADLPLTHWYDLVVLERAVNGRLSLACHQLFAPYARRGDRTELTVDCEPSGTRGTSFAVVASGEHDRRFRPVSVQTAKLPPGRYDLTAELRRPGRVRFHGLPERPHHDDRDWNELVSAVPSRLETPAAAAHLVCAIEISGPPEQVCERLARAEQVVAGAAAELHDLLRVSVLSYGPHRLERGAPDIPETTHVWETDAGTAGTVLRRMAARPAPTGYPGAARLECALTEIADRLHPAGGHTALLTIGDRPANPARAEPSAILPCPRRRNAMTAMQRLMARPGTAFAAIRDRPEAGGELWRRLGGGTPAALDAADVPELCVRLGLVPDAAQRLPFPLAADR